MKNTIHTRSRFLVTLLFGALALAAIVVAAPEAAADPNCNKSVMIPVHINQRVTNRATDRTVKVMIDELQKKEAANTVVIAGLTTEETVNTEDKVPHLTDIPTVGWLFKNKGAAKEKHNLLIFVTPRIVNDAE